MEYGKPGVKGQTWLYLLSLLCAMHYAEVALVLPAVGLLPWSLAWYRACPSEPVLSGLQLLAWGCILV